MILIIVAIAVTGCFTKHNTSNMPTQRSTGASQFDAAELSDLHLKAAGVDLSLLRRTEFVELEDWTNRYLGKQSSPRLLEIVRALPSERISVFAYGPKEKQLGGTIVVFVGLQSKKVQAIYRGR